MADMSKIQNTDTETPPALLEVDCIVTSEGEGFYNADAGEGGSRISRPQPLTGHPPDQNGMGGEYRLVSNIVRDGRLESENNHKRLDEFRKAKKRATEEMGKVYQICDDLYAENEQLRAEAGLCRNCRLSLTGLNKRTQEEQTLQREQALQKKLKEANTLIAQLQHRCKELLDEVARLNDTSCNGAEGSLQYTSDIDSREGLATPKQTESVGNALHSVDPLIQAVREGRQDVVEQSRIAGGPPEQTARPVVEERVKTPSPEDCAIFLADQIKSGPEIKKLLRNLNLSSVDIGDLEERHPRNPKEYRIDGIKSGIVSAKGDRIAFLLEALEKSKLNHQADLFCQEFNIQRPVSKVQPIQVQGAPVVQQPLQASSPDDFADSPCLEPQSDFETVLQPFLVDPTSIHTIAVELGEERDFTPAQLKLFKGSFRGWKQQHRVYLEKECTSRLTMEVLNFWASVEVERRKGPNSIQGIEYLAVALRASERQDILEKLKKFLIKGVVGPSLKRDLYLRKIPSYLLKVEIIRYLGLNKKAGDNDWRALTEHIGHGSQIQFWEQEPHPAEILFDVWKTRNDATIGKLYDWAVIKDRLDIAAVLEKEA